MFISIGIFIYDIFMVHITPFFTSNKKSIMVEVAMSPGTGGNVNRYMGNGYVIIMGNGKWGNGKWLCDNQE